MRLLNVSNLFANIIRFKYYTCLGTQEIDTSNDKGYYKWLIKVETGKIRF